MTISTYVIDRASWRCGGDGPHARGHGITRLRNHEGFKCCLGQVCEQCGILASAMLAIATPGDLRAVLSPVDAEMIAHVATDKNDDSDFAIAAMNLNDNEDLSDRERERQLRDHFTEHGHRIKFVGRYRSKPHLIPQAMLEN